MSWSFCQQASHRLVRLLARNRTRALTIGRCGLSRSHGGRVGVVHCTNQFRSKRPDKAVANRVWVGPPSPILYLWDKRCVLRISRTSLQTLKHQALPPLQQHPTIIQLDRQHVLFVKSLLRQQSVPDLMSTGSVGISAKTDLC
jgi:hypothetical protein